MRLRTFLLLFFSSFSRCKRPCKRLFIPQETNFTTLRYKGNFWSRMKGRDDGRTSVTPGPGHYEHETKKSPTEIRDERIREAKRAAAKQPRFLEALYRQKLRQVILRTRFVTTVITGPSLAKIPSGKAAFVSSYGNLLSGEELSSPRSLRPAEKRV